MLMVTTGAKRGATMAEKPSALRSWWNWSTRSTKDAVEQSLGVQVPLAAPNSLKQYHFPLARYFQNLLNFYIICKE